MELKIYIYMYIYIYIYKYKEVKENRFYQFIDQFNKKIYIYKFYSMLLNKVHPFNNGNGRTRLILFSAVDRKMKKFDEFD